MAAILFVVVLLAACGSAASGGSGQAGSLLKQTFSGPHLVKSGVLGFSLTLTPSGSSTVRAPISIGLSGPFQSRGAGKLPASELNLSIDALGHHGQLGVISTGSTGYLTLGGAAYQLPPADFQKLASSFAGATGGSGTGGLSKLGINPLHWLQNPAIVGQANVGGAVTTHIHARVNVSALLGDLNTFLQKASSSAGASALPGGITPATRQKIAGKVRNATVDVFTGTSDKTLRKLSVNLNFPVSGQYSTLFGGLNSAALGLTVQYANLNQPQTIAAPSNVRPFSGFTAKLKGIIQQIRSALGAGGGTSSGSIAPSSGTGGNSASIGRYSKCLQKAGSDVAKMQKCASLLNGG